MVESEDGGPKERENGASASQGSGRATSRKRFLVTNVVAVAVVASIAVGVYADVTDVALILLLVDPIDDVLMAIP